MAVRREEEKLGAFTLLRHFWRLLAYARGHRWVLAVCIAGSICEAGIELSLPLFLKEGIDRHILPPYMRLDISNPDTKGLIGGKTGYRQPDPSLQVAYIPAASLDRAVKAELETHSLIGKERYFKASGADGSERFISDAEYLTLPKGEQAQIRSGDRTGIMRLAAIYIGLLMINFAVAYAVSMGLNRLGQRAVLAVRGDLFKHLHRLPIKFFDENPVGRLVTRATNDTATLSELFTSVIATAVADVVLFFGIVAVLSSLDLSLTLRLLLLAPPLFALAWWFKFVSQKIYRQIRVQLAKINTYLQEAVSGVSILKTFAREPYASGRFAKYNGDFYRTQMKLIYIFAVFRPLMDAFATSAVAVVIWYGGGEAIQGRISLGTLVAFLVYLKMLFMPLQDLAEKFNIVQSSIVASERIFKILDTPAEITGGGARPEGACGSISFRDVSFAYEDGQPVLDRVSFDVPCGKTVALVGPTGSGKTTIMSLLLGFYPLDPSGGEILIDGIPIGEWDAEELRSLFAYVQQDLFLFSGTLKRNVALFSETAPAILDRAIEVSKLQMLLRRLPSGLAHEVNERGTSLSQGERQLVSFARAISQDPKVLLLDEATASIDSATESLIQEALGSILAGRTALVVAHRLSTVLDAHQILVLNRGRIVERGDHSSLLKMNGLYAHLYHTQFAVVGA